MSDLINQERTKSNWFELEQTELERLAEIELEHVFIPASMNHNCVPQGKYKPQLVLLICPHYIVPTRIKNIKKCNKMQISKKHRNKVGMIA